MRDNRNKFINACEDVGINEPFEYIKEHYLNGMSCNELAEHFLNKYQIKVSAKHLSDKIKENGLIRNYSERKLNAIKRGRMVYHKKPEHEKYSAKSISANIRLKVLQRDNCACTICGNSPKTGYSLELHHINGDESTMENLQTLCFQCHRGMHEIKKEV